MAFSRISILLSTLILLIVFLFDHQTSTFVRADDELREVYDACNQCVKAGNRSDAGADPVGIATNIGVDCVKTNLQGNNSSSASQFVNGVAAENRSDDRTDTVGIATIVVDCIKTHQVAQLQGNNSSSSADRNQDEFARGERDLKNKPLFQTINETESTVEELPHNTADPSSFPDQAAAPRHFPWWAWLLIGCGALTIIVTPVAIWYKNYTRRPAADQGETAADQGETSSSDTEESFINVFASPV